MPASNIHLLKTVNGGDPVSASDIKVGEEFLYPSGAGGAVTVRCASCTDQEALLYSANAAWPITVCVDFRAEDISDEEKDRLKRLVGQLGRLSDPGLTAMDVEDQSLVRRAAELGYIRIISQTQVFWRSA